MAISTSDISGLPDYTDSELLKLYRWALANGAAGTTRTINGRSVTFPGTEDIWKTIDRLEERINAASDNGGIALAEFGEAQ